MRVSDCYPGDTVIIEGERWWFGSMVPEYPDAVQAYTRDRTRKNSGVWMIPLDKKVDELITRGYDEHTSLNELSFLEILIRRGQWKPFGEITVNDMNNEEDVLLSDEELAIYNHIISEFESAGFNPFKPNKYALV